MFSDSPLMEVLRLLLIPGVFSTLGCKKTPPQKNIAVEKFVGAKQTVNSKNRAVDAIVFAMQTTNSNWLPVSESMEEVIATSDEAVPILEAFVRLERDRYDNDYEHQNAYRRARALYLLARIGTSVAEQALVSVLGSKDSPDEFVIISLAILTGEDVVNALVDEAWFDCKHEGDLPKYQLWWQKVGRDKYASRSYGP